MPPSSVPMHLAVALDGAGWHPAAWREPDARPTALFTATYWVDLVREAERGLLDFVTIEDSLSLQSSRRDGPDERTDQVRGRLDAVLIAARVAPLTRNIGLVPTVVVTHTEPFHVSKAIATLDYASTGRAGVRVRVSARPDEAAHFGRRPPPEARGDDRPAGQQLIAALLDEAADYVEVVRRLWDSWEDDAEIRDVATGRFIDRGKLHYIDFTGRYFSVKGPSITPRPPQGQPIVTSHEQVGADLVFAAPDFVDVVVFLDDRRTDRKARLDDLAGPPPGPVFVGTPEELADQLLDQDVRGFRLHPGTLPHDLTAIVRGLVPVLRERGAFRREY